MDNLLKVNTYFKIKLIPFLVISFPLFIDIINGIQQQGGQGEESMIGVLYRGCVVLYSIRCLGHYKYKHYLFFLLTLFGLSVSTHIIAGGFSSGEISSIVKLLYGLFLLAILIGNKKFESIEVVCDCAIFYGVGAAISIILSQIFGFGYASYFDGGFGTKGFFIAMNDVGLVMLMMMCLSLYRYQVTHRLLYFIYGILIAIGSCLVGSMTCLFGTVLVFSCYAFTVCAMRFSDFKSQIYQKVIIIAIIAVASIYIVNQLVTIIMEDAYLSRKYADVGAVFFEQSSREFLITPAKRYIDNQGILEWIFGSNDMFSRAVGNGAGMGNIAKGVESDPLELLGRFGLLITILMFYYPVRILIKSFKEFRKSRTIALFWIFIATSIYLGHGYYGGHALTSPLSTSYFVIFCYLFEKLAANNFIDQSKT